MSVNRASEAWKEIKPFALRDLGAVDSKSAGAGGVGGYFIILYDVSAKKLRYYSASTDGLNGALAAAGSGDIVFLPACTIVPKEAATYEVRDELSSGAITVTAEAGVEISGLTVGKWYAVEATGGPWFCNPAEPTYGDTYFSLSDGSGFSGAIGLKTYPGPEVNFDGAITGFNLILPDFGAFAEAVDANYGRVYFKATATSIHIRVCDMPTHFYDNAGTLGYSLKNAICAGPTTIPSGVEVAGMGENCILDGSVENNGMLTGVKITGEITGTGSQHIFDSDSAWTTNKQIKSSETVASPFEVASAVVNTNLNADLLDGNHASAFLGGGGNWQHIGQTVFTGNGPGGAFTDLDLSAIVGNRRCFVMLKFICNTTSDGGAGLVVRTNGDTHPSSFWGWSHGVGASGSAFTNGDQAFLVTETDETGIIEWTDDEPTNNWTIILVGFVGGGGTGDGDVIGPAGATNNNVVVFDTTTGKLIKDSGSTLPVKATGAEINTGTDDAKFATSKAIADSKVVKGPASAVANRVVIFDGVTGKLIKDSGLALSGSNTGDQTLPVKATGAEINTGTDDAKFATSKAIADSKVVITDATQTLSGKTLTAPIVAILKPAADSTTAVKITKADGATPVVTVDTTSGKMTIPAGGIDATNGNVRSLTLPIPDDGATSFTPSKSSGFLFIAHVGTSGIYGIIAYNTPAPTTTICVGHVSLEVTTGVLTGTTGTDTKMTVSCHTDGKIYIENRTGGTKTFAVLLI